MNVIKLADRFSSNANAGRAISRRRMIAGTAAFGAAALAGLGYKPQTTLAQAGAFVATPALTEGPYFVDEMLNRADIRVDPSDNSTAAGLPIYLGITVSRLENGVVTPLPNAYVDIWQCDALGRYSDIRSEGTAGRKFLRGYQVTGAHGTARFVTVYPGWYSGRAVHIHSKVRLFNGNQRIYQFNTQFFFDESLTDAVHQLAPYNQKGYRNVLNTTDNIYRCTTSVGTAGTRLHLRMAADGTHAVASFHLALNVAGSNPSCGGF